MWRGLGWHRWFFPKTEELNSLDVKNKTCIKLHSVAKKFCIEYLICKRLINKKALSRLVNLHDFPDNDCRVAHFGTCVFFSLPVFFFARRRDKAIKNY